MVKNTDTCITFVRVMILVGFIFGLKTPVDINRF